MKNILHWGWLYVQESGRLTSIVGRFSQVKRWRFHFGYNTRLTCLIKHGRTDLIRTFSVRVSLNRQTNFLRLAFVKAPSQPSLSSELRIYAKQWSLISCSCKTTTLTKFYTSYSASLFRYTVYNGKLPLDKHHLSAVF